ncbi:MAG: protein kinase [Verrucomicrobiales bacterium]|nr:protein kinase [Verrucomicrobiales bacterium]
MTIPDHELLRPIGRGSYGEVWLARSVLGELRAVKLVRHSGAADSGPAGREFAGLRRFEPVSRSHPGLVHILHAGRFDGGFYYVMELADDSSESRLQPARASDALHAGVSPALHRLKAELRTYSPRTLRRELQQRGRLPVSECLDLALKLTDALAHLHGHGLVHRDLKPSNIIFVGGQPKLADIGLVASVDASMTCVGTEGYLPPEGPGKPPADLYALGKVLYELATGRDRTDFPELPTLLRADPDRPALEEFNEVILKACDPDLRRRYQTAAQMRADLLLMQSGRSLSGARTLRRRLVFARRAGALVGVAALLAVAAYFYQQTQTREARRLALENQQLAVKEAGERQRAEGLLNTLQSKQAEHYFENDDANRGVAYLARLLRQNPTNQILASRLMSALMDRSFALPVWSLEPWDFQAGADFNPNGRVLITWGRSGSNHVAQLKDVATGQDVGRPMQHDAPIRRARFSPDGRLLATMAADGVARIWDGVTGEPMSDALPPLGRVFRGTHIQEEHLAFSPDRQVLVTAGFREARLWKVATGELLAARLDHGAVVWDVGFSPDSRLVATSGDNKTRLWDVASGELRHTLDVGDGGGECVARFSADGRRIVGIGGFHARVWDVQSGERILVLDRDCLVSSAAFSPDGVRLGTADAVRTVQLFDASNGRLLLPPILHGDVVREVSFDATGERILTREPRRVRVWDSRTGRALTEWMLHTEDLHSAQLGPDGTHVLTTTARSITLWDARPGQALNLALRHARTLVPSARFSGDGIRVVTAGGGDFPVWTQEGVGEAMVWDARTGASLGTRMATSDGIQYAEFGPDGRRVVTACLNGEARVWDAQTGAAVTDAMIHGDVVNSARFSPDGERIVTASDDGTARIWEATTGRQLIAALEHSNAVLYAEFSPDGRAVLSVPQFHAARTWDAQTGRPTGSFGQSIVTARFSPDGQRIVTGSSDATGQVWDRKTGQPVGQPLKHRDHIQSVRFSRDGRLVVTASRDQSARVWDAFTGNPLAEPLRHKGAVLDAGFSPDGLRVVTASEDYTARVWDVRTGQPLTEPLREGHFVGGAEFSPDGTRMVAATANGLARIWELPPASLPVPAWLPDLADAVAGTTWTDQEVLVPVSPSEYLNRCAKLLRAAASDDRNRWMRWLLAVRDDRTVSHASPATFSDHLSRLLEQKHELRDLREALHLAPGNPFAMARLAARLVGPEYGEMAKHPHREQQADFLSERAVILAPEHGELWRIRSEVLDKSGRREEALAAIERAVTLAGNESESWSLKGRMLEDAGRNEEAFRAYSKALEVRKEKTSPGGLTNTGTALPVVREHGLALGILRCEIFSDLPGNRLADLTKTVRFPRLPDRVDFVPQFEAPANFADHFGARLTGYLLPPKTGEYRFYLNSDDEGALFLSTDDSPGNAREVAHEPVWSPPRAWTAHDQRPNRENVSAPILLEAGRRYYVEALMKEGTGTENLAVAWQTPGELIPEHGASPIPGKYLAVPAEWLEGGN